MVGKISECSTSQGAWKIRNSYPHTAFFLIPRSFPFQSACNGWHILPSFPTVPRGSKHLLRERKSLFCCLPLWERKHMNDLIVAITASLSWLINRTNSILDWNWEGNSELPLPYILCNKGLNNQFWNLPGSCLLLNHWMLNMFNQLWLCWVATLILKQNLKL